MANTPTTAFYETTTRDILVRAAPFYLADQSEPDEDRFVWAYRITIENRGRSTVQLISRTWRITDAQGRTKLVQGEGVVGEQPVLKPGEAFEYTSGTPLDTPSGFMAGDYHMVDRTSGAAFDVTIPAFSLDSPYQPSRLH
jgi:ApaG protein